MENVTVKKADVLEILNVNRNKHRTIFLEAVEGYKESAIKQLQNHIQEILKGKVTKVYIVMPQPEDHTKDYDRAIKMLEMSVDTNISMDEKSFQRYILDDWTWKREFLASNSFYSKTAKDIYDKLGTDE